MSDDLFWPPLSGGEDDERRYPGPPESTTAPLPDASTGGMPPRTPRRWTTAALVGVTAFVFGGGGAAIGAALADNDGSSSLPSAGLNVATGTPSSLDLSPKSYAAIAAKVLPSVVSINVTNPSSGAADTGSGIILRPDGYILTNDHVVAAASNGGQVSVTFNDGSTSRARLVGTDSLDDLAVIKVAKNGLTAAVLGNSSQIRVGDPVLAVGSPLGLTGTVTSGIVSALNRPVQTQEQPQQLNPFGLGNGSGSTPSSQPTVIEAIQTDAAINPGNSGGALVDADGQVIGVNSAIASLGSDLLGSQSGNIGVGFAIPIDQARVIAAELIDTGHATHPLLGVTLTDATSSNGIDRALVHSVTPGGPAAKAGLKGGDVITGIDGQPTAGSDAVIAAIRTHQPGQRIIVAFVRGGVSKTVSVVLANETTSSS